MHAKNPKRVPHWGQNGSTPAVKSEKISTWRIMILPMSGDKDSRCTRLLGGVVFCDLISIFPFLISDLRLFASI
jgi:hypothetical protein